MKRLARAECHVSDLERRRQLPGSTLETMRGGLLHLLRGEVGWPHAVLTADPPEIAAMRTELLAEVARRCP